MIPKWLDRLYRRHFFATDWNIGIVQASPADLEKLVNEGKLGQIRWCPDFSPFRFRADPFIWPLEGEPRVIYEEMDHIKRRAHIRSRSLSGFTRVRRSRAEIVRSFHLSYPFIFQSEGIWYCVPESARGGGVDLYAWDGLTVSWKLVRRLIDNVGVLDATLFRHGGIWYLFGTIRGDGSYDRLRIWWSDRLEGEWRPHRNDPAKVDIRSARPAGPIFEIACRWYRPAQDCAAGYGHALTINRIELLTPDQFEETTVSRIEPDPNSPYPYGLHTLAVGKDIVIVDGKREGFSVSLPAVKAARRILRAFGRA